MSRHKIEFVGLDPEDLTAKQWRQIFKRARFSLGPADEEQRDEQADKAAKENDDLVDLQEEKKGKSKPPTVKADDLPEGIAEAEEADEKPKKKGRG